MLDPQRQFRVLCRDFLARMVDLELLSAQGDPRKLFAQAVGLLGALSFVLTIYLVPQYAFSDVPREKLALAGWGDQEFLISTTMAVVGLFAVLAWDTVFPDRRDSLVLGMLPVGPRTIFTAKIAAIALALGIAIAAVNACTGLTYPLVVIAPGAGWLGAPRALLAYWVTMTAAGLFVFCGLLAIQGFAAQFLSYRLFLRVSSFLQLAAFFVVLGVYFLSPGPSEFSLTAPEYQWLIAKLPSFWFLGLFQTINGSAEPVFGWLAWCAIRNLLVVMAAAAGAYWLTYFRNIRRMIEQPDILPGDRSRPAARLLTSMVKKFVRKPLDRAILLFNARTLARSRQHRVILAAFGGIALAISFAFGKSFLYGSSRMYAIVRQYGYRPPRWNEPNIPFMAASLVLLFFAVIGTRSVFSLPATLKANWIFRMTAVHSPRSYFSAVRTSVYALAAAPVWLVSGVLFLGFWPLLPALVHVTILILTGVTLVERSLAEFRKVPFACSYLPGASHLQFKLGAYGIAFLMAIYAGAAMERSMLETLPRAVVLFAFLIAVAIRSRLRWAELAALPHERLQFEDREAAEVAPLDLHDAATYSGEERYIDVFHAPPGASFLPRARAAARRAGFAMLAVIAVGFTYERIEQHLHPLPPRVGTLVDVGGRSLNYFCAGQGTPTVIFESGRGGPGIGWEPIMRQITPLTRACWYDRAGYGWSHAAPFPHPASAIAGDLHGLLKSAGERPPYILVGASFGGICVRVYTWFYPADVAGMVLVDSTHVDEQLPILPPGSGYLPYYPRFLPEMAQVLRQIGVLRVFGYSSAFEPRTLAESLKELDYESLLQARAAGKMGDRPLIVLTAGIHTIQPPGTPAELRRIRAAEQNWIESQGQLARLSTRGRQVILRENRHDLQHDRPDAVIAAVREVVDDVRHRHQQE